MTDTLDPDLDFSTFELTEIAFANQAVLVPEGLSRHQTSLGFTITNRTLIPLGDGPSRVEPLFQAQAGLRGA